MANVKLVALRRHPFGVGFREAGEEYEATQDEAATLTALGWSRAAKEKAEKAEADEKPAKPAKGPAKKQAYRTRDLKAKG